MKKTIFFFYFLSGAAGLIYETIWIRQLSPVFGGTGYALGMVLTAFMLGLAGGSFLLGKSSSWGVPLKLYGILELGIGLWGLGLPFLFKGLDTLLGRIVPIFLPGSIYLLAIKFFLSLFVLVIPCGLMGGTFPVLGRYVVNNKDTVGYSVGVLYGLNLLGAVLGCVVSGFVLIEHLGLALTNHVAVVLNLGVGLITLSLWRKTKDENIPVRKEKDSHHALRYWALGAVFFSGLFALSLEVITHRVLLLILRNTTYAYTLMLAITLLGLFAGNFLISKWADRIKKPSLVIAGALAAAALYSVITIPLYRWMSGVFYDFVIGKDFFSGSWLPFLLTQTAVCIAALSIPMLLLGAVFPLSCRVCFHSLPDPFSETGRYLGGLYAANTIGAILGSLGTSFIGIPLFGTQPTLFFFVGLLLVGCALLLGGSPEGRPREKIIGAGGVLLVFLLLTPVAKKDLTFRDAARGETEEIIFYKEDQELLIEVLKDTQTGVRKLLSNRQQQEGDSSLSSIYNLRQPYYLPLLLHPRPRHVLGIGMGTGISFAAVKGFDIDSAECVELSPAIIEAVPLFSRYNREIYQDPRIKIVREDGRQYLKRSEKRYDVILADLFTSYRLGVGALYTKEHFESCRDHLAPGGILSQLLPIHQLPPKSLKIILRTFREVFPNSTLWMTRWALVVMGSPDPIQIDFQTIKKHFDRPEIRRDLKSNLLDDPYEFLAAFVMGGEGIAKYTAGYPLNTDDRPLVEFITPRSFHLLTDGPLYWTNFKDILDYRQSVVSYMVNPTEDVEQNIQRYYQAKSHSIKGKLYNADGEYVKALEEFRTAYSLDQYDMEARKFLEAYYIRTGKEFYQYKMYKEARRNFEKALEHYPLSVEALLYLGRRTVSGAD
jgi:spermidine synthase